MEGGAEEELERRSKFLHSLIQKKKAVEQQEQNESLNVRVRASDMPIPLQSRAFRCARDHLDSMPPGKLDSKRLALALKKEFDSSYGPAWHCIVGTSFGSYVTHSLGGFLYFSIDKLFIPGCTGLTPEGVIRAVKTLSQHGHSLKNLHINGIYHLEKHHIETLHSYLQNNLAEQHIPRPLIVYHEYRNLSTIRHYKDQPVMDMETCPRCVEPRMVFGCPRKTCKIKMEKSSVMGCRGCISCIPRCIECGVCFEFDDELEEAVCEDSLCLDCWLQLPKCNFCNKPYCKRHAEQKRCYSSGSAGFVCEVCEVNGTLCNVDEE
ncbi:Dynein light chain [Parasponia andersonii]|uniref:Dynein light chain n=1 Tax=Parasponia andersonii TaxID=3476 RepID=A0A2P5CNZ0_PARAD|nr:Dynein light chain [Parasponia andersonii]